MLHCLGHLTFSVGNYPQRCMIDLKVGKNLWRISQSLL